MVVGHFEDEEIFENDVVHAAGGFGLAEERQLGNLSQHGTSSPNARFRVLVSDIGTLTGKFEKEGEFSCETKRP
jgi:hypothetical protein